jgi:outer membrane receptor protein involved in Fe transport
MLLLTLLAPGALAGQLEGVVFTPDGGPAAGVEVSVAGGAFARTDEDGAFRFELPGGRYVLQLQGLSTEPIPVLEEGVTEALLTVHAGRLFASVEAPPGAAGAGEALAAGWIRGVVLDAEQGAPVEGVRVYVRGQPVEALTDAAGVFALEVPEGTHDLSLIRSGYASLSRPGVAVAAEQTAEVALELVPAGLELEAFTVSAPRIVGGTADLLSERKASGNVGEMLGAEQMARSGDSNAAAALSRVTGLTVVGGKYVYVRGLGERYSSTLLNGSSLPSPEPERRVVPLDLFPASILDSVVIQKSYSVERPGEFGGGTIELRTRGVPSSPMLKVGLSTGYTQATTFQTGITGPRGPTDFWGFDGGFRDLPEAVQQASDESPLEEGDMFSDLGYTASELEALGEAMPDRWYVRPFEIPMDLGASLAAGRGWEVGGGRLGALGALTFSNGWEMSEFTRSYYLLGGGGELELSHEYDFLSVENQIRAGAIAVLVAELGPDHTINATSVVNRSTDYESRIYEGYNRDLGSDIRVTRNRWVERQLWFNQLEGSHRLGTDGPGGLRPELCWRYALSLASRLEPDRREWRQDLEPGTDTWYLSDRPEGNQIVYSDLGDINHDAGVDLRLPFGAVTTRAGVNAVFRDRLVDTRRYKYMHKGEYSRDEGVLSSEVDEIFTPETIGPDGFQFEEITRQTDNYTARQRIQAGYGKAEVALGERLRLDGGLRVERSLQEVETFELFNPDSVPVTAELETTDLLPAGTLTFNLTDDQLLRAGYGRTLSRPDFRELSPATFNDVTGGRQIYGNPDLDRAIIHNADLRWEWFLSETELISVGGFYKRFLNPIETTVVVSAQLSVTYQNAEEAENLGAELEFRKDLFGDFYSAGNLALIRSRVTLADDAGIQTSDRRPLQGQSPYVVNLSLGYADPDSGTDLSLLYNVFGPRIDEVGALGVPDAYEMPAHRLDAVLSQGLPRGLRFSLKGTNLLNPVYRKEQGGYTTESLRKGWGVSAGLSWGL